MSYKISQVALQLYTLRNFCGTADELKTTAEKVRKIGYESVQFSGSNVPYDEARKILTDAGLSICATHESSDLILNEPEAVCARLAQIGTKHTAYPAPTGINLSDATAVQNLAKRLDAAGAALARNGCMLSYHNHSLEFVRYGEGTVLDYLVQATDPAHLKFELDTYWVQYGGSDPVAWIKGLPKRVPLLHIKDYVFTSENKPAFAEIGRGNLNWLRILAAAENSGVEWLIVEQDICPGDPFDSIRISFEFLQSILGK